MYRRLAVYGPVAPCTLVSGTTFAWATSTVIMLVLARLVWLRVRSSWLVSRHSTAGNWMIDSGGNLVGAFQRTCCHRAAHHKMAQTPHAVTAI